MTNNTLVIIRVIGLALIIAGIGLGYWGHEMSESIGSQFSKAFTGSHTDKVMHYYLGGAVSFVIGVYLFFRK